ncbi:hypothetical protein Hypma_005203 [Hypsizygus marmoreus]|uniref:Uncharacterized protein n=1 Tax=Hypsizygus marmoreus TaxID=39966 RepID=A0A369K061_HYPMA|nr:hypothetical protein Hypma_005203 [Hypsizygus marmoreus]
MSNTRPQQYQTRPAAAHPFRLLCNRCCSQVEKQSALDELETTIERYEAILREANVVDLAFLCASSLFESLDATFFLIVDLGPGITQIDGLCTLRSVDMTTMVFALLRSTKSLTGRGTKSSYTAGEERNG